MNAIQITCTVLAVIYAIMFFGYIFSTCFKPDFVVFGISILFIISIFLNFYKTSKEKFYFEVSPQRKKCLIEQVALTPNNKRSCNCCQKGTVGGYPPHYGQWFEKSPDNGWQRTDNWTSDQQEVNLLPPTVYVGPPAIEQKPETMKSKLKRSQVEMYNQVLNNDSRSLVEHG
jgi:hypothetical protein